MARKSKYTHDQRAALRKARQKKQEKYWEDRAQSRVLATDRQVDAIRKDSDRAYRDARDAVRREIDKFYRDFATAAGISEDEARQKLSRGELQDFKKELERKRKIIQAMLRNDPDNDKLRAYDTEFEKLSKVRELTRKESLETNIKAEIVKLGGTQEQQLDARSQNVVRNALWMNSADLTMLGDVDTKLGVGHPKQVERAARENWQYGDFSARIWDDKEKLIREAREIIENGFARNKGAYDMAGDLMTRMNVSHSNALRLVRTEFNHLSNQAALAEYQAKGIRKYKFVSAIDSRTCDVCADLNGQVFNVADAKVGLNFPPMHPNCRSVTTPVIDWDDEDEWDYSGIELDDDELKQLGLTDEDVSAIDSETPMATDAPAPSLTVQQANQATEDTQSVQRRAEQAERIQKQTQDLEVDVRKQMERLDDINDAIKRLENINQRLDAQDVPMTLPRAAIEAENLERIDINLSEKELEVLRLQERAAKLDPSVPKPDRGKQNRLADEIDAAKTKREERQKKDLSDAEIIAQATPKPTPIPAKTVEDADEPQTSVGKLWKRLKYDVEKLRRKFEHSRMTFRIKSALLDPSVADREFTRYLFDTLNVGETDPYLEQISREFERLETIQSKANLVNSALDSIVGGKSKWNGTIEPIPEEMQRHYSGLLLGGYQPERHVVLLPSDASLETVMHELLHARSESIGPIRRFFMTNEDRVVEDNIEDALCEFLSIAIGKKMGRKCPSDVAYVVLVNQILQLHSLTANMGAIEFASQLINVPNGHRFKAFMSLISQNVQSGDLTKSEISAIEHNVREAFLLPREAL